MSQHHRAQKWSTNSPKLRKLIKPQLPMACVDCGQPVMPEHKWQVGHRPGSAASQGGPATLQNVGPSHSKSALWPRNCNQIAGGKLGARVTNAGRRAARQAPDIRAW